MTELSERYDRNMRLFGAAGQAKLKATTATIVGVGGLGSPLSQHLALLGVGRLNLVDDEELDNTNRNRFVGCRHNDPVPGSLKVSLAERYVRETNPDVEVSQNHFLDDRTYVAMLAWLPEHLIYGKPYIVDVVVVSGASVAKSRDDHYHNPPDYIVLEPEDTTQRTKNLQQTNTNGYKFQGTPELFSSAKKIVESWGKDGRIYKTTPEYQKLLRDLQSRFLYRLASIQNMRSQVRSHIKLRWP